MNKRTIAISLLSAILAAPVSQHARADYFPFRVAFEDVPGVEQLTSGEIEAGIEELERAATSASGETLAHTIATPCGAYTVNQDFDKAWETCNRAVKEFPGDTSYNNRGVLRVFGGDFEGATRDFDRARPSNMDEYLAWLRTKDIGLVADGNTRLLNQLKAKHTPEEVVGSTATARTAKVEPIVDR